MSPIGSVSPNAVNQAALAAAQFGSVSPTVVREIEDAAARLFSDAAAAKLSSPSQGLPDGAPELRSPDLALAYASFVDGGEEAARNLTTDAQFTLLMGKLLGTIRNANASDIAAKAQLLKASREQQQANFEGLVAAESEAQAALDNAIGAAIEAAEEAQRKLELANQASTRVGDLQSRLDGLPPGATDRSEAEAELALAKDEHETLRASAQEALTASDDANAKLLASQEELTRVQADVDRLTTTLTLPGLSLPRDHLTSNAQLQKLMAQLHVIIGQAAKEDLKSKSELAIEQLKAQEAENLRQAKEQAEKLAQAEKINKILGCIMKLVMAIVAVVSVVATILTGGIAGALVAGALLAVTLISDAAGFNLIEKAMQPLMEHVIQPLIKAVAGVLEKFALKLGADPAKAAEISNYIAMAVVAAVVVALVVVAMVASRSPQVAKLTDKLMTMMVNMATKLAPGAVNAASKLGAELTGAMAKALGQNVAKHTGRVQVAAAVTQTATQTAGGVGNAVAAQYRVEAAEAGAAVELGLASSDLVRERMRAAQDDFAKINEFLQAILLRMSEVTAQASQSGAGMLRNLTA